MKNMLAAALLLLTGMTWSAEERVRVDGAALVRVPVHAGTTYRVDVTSRCGCYAPQPRVVVPLVAVLDASGATVATNPTVTAAAPREGQFALETSLTFTAAADGEYAIRITAAETRGAIVGTFREKVSRGSFGGKSVVTSTWSTEETDVRGASSGNVFVRVSE
ncbi:MAG TPA: hypothetical protein VMU84_13440 [Thermoanaerobaculia bacterium]|nr:hypothetical protein [Thermoanaerobaculia bacterium]